MSLQLRICVLMSLRLTFRHRQFEEGTSLALNKIEHVQLICTAPHNFQKGLRWRARTSVIDSAGCAERLPLTRV